jgi:hypothetical protein
VRLRRFVAAASLARTPSEGLSLALVLLCVQRDVPSSWAGVLVAATSFPQIVSGPLLGARLDRAGNIWASVRVAGAATAAAIAGIAGLLGHGPLAVALVLCVVVALAEPTFSGGISAAADRTLLGDAATSAHAWDSFSYNVAGLLAPALVTIVAATAGAAGATASLAIAVVIGSIVSLGLRAAPHDSAHTSEAAPLGVRPALAAIWASAPLRAVTVSTTVAFVGTGGLAFAAVAATRAADRPANDAGQLFTVLAAGGLLGSWLMTRRPSPRRPDRVVVGSLGAMGLVLAGMATTTWWPLLLCGAALLGALDGPLLVGLFGARVGGTPAGLRATVFTLGASAKLGASAVGAVIGGSLLGGRSTTLGLVLVGGLHLVAAAMAAPAAARPAAQATGVAR